VNPLALTVLAMCLSFGRCGTVEKGWPECLEEGSQNSVLSGLSGKLGRQ
jgi:hypothetical protein